MTIPFERRRFRSTAAFYATHRVRYPDDLIERVAERVSLSPGDGVLDLGCGPGLLALAFARLGARVTALDPEPEMVEACRKAARDASLAVDVREGSSYDLPSDLGSLRLVVMGRSFHWMDREATLAALDPLIAAHGAVVLFQDRRIAADPDWREVLERLSQTFSPERSAMRRQRRSGWVTHERVLLHSAFGHLERLGRVVKTTIDSNAIVGRAFSMSVTSPDALGLHRAMFEGALRRELRALSPTDRFVEIVEPEALLAFRKPPAFA